MNKMQRIRYFSTPLKRPFQAKKSHEQLVTQDPKLSQDTPDPKLSQHTQYQKGKFQKVHQIIFLLEKL